MDQNEKQAEEPKKKRSKVAPIILGIVVLLGGGYAVRTYLWNLHHESTDDAQIEGNISPVLPRISGYVTEIRFEDNQHVHKGDTLIKLDDHDLRIKLEQAIAALDNAKANAEVMRANAGSVSSGITTAESNIAVADARVKKAEEDFRRYTALLAEHATTQAQYDAVKAERDAALAQKDVTNKQLNAARAQSSAANEQIAVAESVVHQREVDVEYAQLQLSYASLLAPADGIVSRKSVQPGQYVQAGQALFSVVDDQTVWVVANFKETQLAKMEAGQSVEVTVDAFSDEPLHGEINTFSAATGARFALLPPDNASGNFVKVVQRVPVKIKLQVDAAMLQKLRPGLSVSVVVNTDEHPQQSVAAQQN